jgi:hypothetical protein
MKSRMHFAIIGDKGDCCVLRSLRPADKGKQMSSTYTMKGVQDLLEVFEDKVTITPKGVLGFMNKGLKVT